MAKAVVWRFNFMSGHSKWATTHRQKAVVDAKRSSVFTKLANIITIAARKGGDPDANASLRAAIDKAREANMPKDNIERAIKKGTGELGGALVEELYYEAVGPHNTQFIIKCLTDNRNRSAANVRHIFSKYSGSLGAVMWNFDQKGVIRIAASELGKIDLDSLELELIDAGADDIKKEEEGLTVYCASDKLAQLRDFFAKHNLALETSDAEYVAKEQQSLNEEEQVVIDKIIDELDDCEDVSDYYSNLK
jgi:YebC/PmpR family DNA-binding regulatory protein